MELRSSEDRIMLDLTTTDRRFNQGVLIAHEADFSLGSTLLSIKFSRCRLLRVSVTIVGGIFGKLVS
jgi:hypothetical protein